MLWLVFDERLGQELLLCVPRQAPGGTAAMDYWLRTVNAVARLSHPNIAPVIEVGQIENWPYAAYERSLGETLDERLSRQSSPLPIGRRTGWRNTFRASRSRMRPAIRIAMCRALRC